MTPRSGQSDAPRTNGFTLVELMIVIAIMGLMASIVIFAFPDGSSKLDQDAQRFAARTAALRDNAILQSRPMAVQITPSGYSFLVRRDGSWDTMQDKPFISTDWSSGVSAVVGDTGSLLISFESTGLPSDQAELILRYDTVERAVMIAPMGDVTLVGSEQ